MGDPQSRSNPMLQRDVDVFLCVDTWQHTQSQRMPLHSLGDVRELHGRDTCHTILDCREWVRSLVHCPTEDMVEQYDLVEPHSMSMIIPVKDYRVCEGDSHECSTRHWQQLSCWVHICI